MALALRANPWYGVPLRVANAMGAQLMAAAAVAARQATADLATERLHVAQRGRIDSEMALQSHEQARCSASQRVQLFDSEDDIGYMYVFANYSNGDAHQLGRHPLVVAVVQPACLERQATHSTAPSLKKRLHVELPHQQPASSARAGGGGGWLMITP